MRNRILGAACALALVASAAAKHSLRNETKPAPSAREATPAQPDHAASQVSGMRSGPLEPYHLEEFLDLVGPLDPVRELRVRERFDELNLGWRELQEDKARLLNRYVAEAFRQGRYQVRNGDELPHTPGAVSLTVGIVRGVPVALEMFPGDAPEIDAVRAEIENYTLYADASVQALLWELKR